MTRRRGLRAALTSYDRAHLRSARGQRSRALHQRRLHIEPLEDRRLLAVFTVDNLNDAGPGSLRQAIDDANFAFGADTIEFQAGLTGTIPLSTGEMTITDELLIDGPGAANLTIDAQQNSRIFRITLFSGPVTIAGLELTGGNVVGDGGAIFSESFELLSIESTTISGNTATGPAVHYGGGIIASGDVMVIDSTISGNSVTGDTVGAGGGVAATGDLTVIGSTVSGNSALGGTVFGFGGGIAARGEVRVVGSTFSANSATSSYLGSGGGVFAFVNDVTVINSTISGNFATGGFIGRGGGVATYNGDVTVVDSTISGNSAIGNVMGSGVGFGGGIGARGQVTVEGSMILDNSATGERNGHGGGVYADDDAMVTDSTVSGNSAAGQLNGYGGGVYANGNAIVSGSTLTGNSVAGEVIGYGGGIASRGEVSVSTSTIAENAANDSASPGGAAGGGVAAELGVGVFQSSISGNSATSDSSSVYGGGIATRGTVVVANSTLSGNSATSNSLGAFGGGVLAYGDVEVRNSTLSGNSATGGQFGTAAGGGINVFFDSLAIENSIIADNHTNVGASPDLSPGIGPLKVDFSLIGDNTDTGLAPAPVGLPDANGNLIGTMVAPIDPMLGPLQDNGGHTFTHALLAGSPAIDAGDAAFAPPPFTDQRGFLRLADGGGGVQRVDMGSFEFASTLAADGNGDGTVGPQDYTVWANNFGASGQDIPGDYNNDGVVGPQDYTLWANNFGTSNPPVPAAVSQSIKSTQEASVREDASAVSHKRDTTDSVRDIAIQQLTNAGVVHDQLLNIDRFWALLNAGLIGSEDDAAASDKPSRER